MLVKRLIVVGALAAVCGRAQTAPDALDAPAVPPAAGSAWSIHFQATSIGQEHGSFHSLYAGANSLPNHPEHRVSLTATIFLALRFSPCWELVVNPEVAGGRGFGQVTGIAGFTNGEIPRVASATPALYPARAYVRFTLPLGGSAVRTPDGPNQTAGYTYPSRMTTIAGKFAITDFFDNNSYSHDPRAQFMNWALMSNGAWDYPADTRGYTIGLIQELRTRSWAVRAASVMVATEANGPTFDTRIGKNRGVAVEFEHDFGVAGRNGAIRALGFENRERAGSYREAIQAATPADLGPTRRPGARKYGFGLNAEQAVTPDIGLFARYGWNDGKTESWAFTEIDRGVSAGAQFQGRIWGRRRDRVGIGAARNYLSGDHRNYLAHGGLGFIIGDGRLDHYRPEQIAEAYYALGLVKDWTFTFDWQGIQNPAYNADRGPVSALTLRVHWER